MKNRIGAMLFLGAACCMNPIMAESPAARNGVLVELFTSQGCSSCPPAERLFNQMEQVNERAIPLAFHVDYWDYLGWKDPFANPDWTERQKLYGGKFDLRSIYTPQAVVAGAKQMNGADASSIRSAIEKSKSAVVFELKTYEPSTGAKAGAVGLTLHMKCGGKLAEDVLVEVAITESKLETDVGRGENGGRKLPENHVVRRMMDVARLAVSEANETGGFQRDITLILDAGWKRKNLDVVVFAKGADSMSVLGAATLPLE